MHPPAAYSQQGDRHQQQPESGKGNDNKTEDAVVRKNVQNCRRLARPLKLKVSFQPLKYACP